MLPAAALQQGQKTFASVFIVTGQGCNNSTPWGRQVEWPFIYFPSWFLIERLQ